MFVRNHTTSNLCLDGFLFLLRAGVVRLRNIWEKFFKNMSTFEESNFNAVAQLTRSFILFMLGRTLLSTTGETVHSGVSLHLKILKKLEGLTRVSHDVCLIWLHVCNI